MQAHSYVCSCNNCRTSASVRWRSQVPRLRPSNLFITTVMRSGEVLGRSKLPRGLFRLPNAMLNVWGRGSFGAGVVGLFVLAAFVPAKPLCLLEAMTNIYNVWIDVPFSWVASPSPSASPIGRVCWYYSSFASGPRASVMHQSSLVGMQQPPPLCHVHVAPFAMPLPTLVLGI